MVEPQENALPKRKEIALKTPRKIALVVVVTLMVGSVGIASAAPPLKTAAGSNAEAHNNEGITSYKNGNWKAGHDHFKEAVEADPKSAEAHYNLALALDKMGEHMSAARHFKMAADLGKENPDIQNSSILNAHLKMLPGEPSTAPPSAPGDFSVN